MNAHHDESTKKGYKHPPKAHQFKPGQSGNPSGRRKPLAKFDDVMRRELKKKRTITEDGKKRSVETYEIFFKRLIDIALKGNIKALLLLMDMARSISTEDNKKWAEITSDMPAQQAAELYLKAIKEVFVS